MSDEGVRLIMRAALVIGLIAVAALFKVLVGPSKRRGRIMLVGTLAGVSSGVLLSFPIQERFDVELSVILACVGMVFGWAITWVWARAKIQGDQPLRPHAAEGTWSSRTKRD